MYYIIIVMSYYSDFKYSANTPWYEAFLFNRWFKGSAGPILDVACATGDFISVNPNIIEGIDIDEDSMRIARDRGYRVRKINVDNGEMRQLPENTYSGVMARQIIEHLHNPLEFLIEIKRVLKPGGLAVILTPNCPYMLQKYFWDDYTHKRPLTKKSLRMVAYDAGFRDIVVYEEFRPLFGMGFILRNLKISPRLLQKIQRIFFIRGLSLVMELKK